jgi:hypothetical protein
MQALVFLGLVLGNLALLVHLSEKAIHLRKSWKDHRLLVNNHPEMESNVNVPLLWLRLQHLLLGRDPSGIN